MCAMAERARLDSVLSFSRGAPQVADRPHNDEASDAGSYDDEEQSFEFEFAFAPPLTPAGHEGDDHSLALADDLFAHGRIVPAYPVWDRRVGRDDDAAQAASTAPPSPDSYCAWAPRSAPGSPARESFPKSASASAGEARRFWRLRDLVAGAGGRSHSDGKEKFVFLQPTAPSKMSSSSSHGVDKQSSKPSAPLQQTKQGKKKSKQAGAVTEMDMATAHRLFYSKQPGPGDRRPQQQQSYLPYRPGIVGFFATAHALGRSHHPY